MKKYLIIALVMLLAFALASCIEQDNSITTTTTQAITPEPPIIKSDSEGLEFELNEDGLSYSVVGIGTCTDTDIVIPSTHKGLPVTIIGDMAFAAIDLENQVILESDITSIVIPNSIEKIGMGAFAYCTSLTSIEIPSSVTSIGDGAFVVCVSLTNVTIGDGLISIENNTFANCSSLKDIIIPNSVTSIGDYAFSDCTALTNVVIGNSVTKIGDYAFSDCTALTNVTIGNNVTSIGESAFSLCTSLTSIIIPNSVISIGDNAFYRTSLISVTIGESVTNIGISTFYACTSLIEVCNKSSLNITVGLPDYGCVAYYAKSIITDETQSSIKYIEDYVFYDDGTEIFFVKYLGNQTELTLIEYEGGKKYGIYQGAFYYNDKITKVIIPNSVTSIGERAFSNCTSLNSIIIGDSVTSIGLCSFNNCTSLLSIIIPISVTRIDYNAFLSCTSLTIYCEAESKPIGWDSSWSFGNPVIWGYKDN